MLHNKIFAGTDSAPSHPHHCVTHTGDSLSCNSPLSPLKFWMSKKAALEQDGLKARGMHVDVLFWLLPCRAELPSRGGSALVT